jgi:prepilin-type N-terminal cleavage/methylation domain-containing protein
MQGRILSARSVVERRRAGFTLVEVIVVLVILAILAAIAIPALTGYIDKSREKALISQARASAEAIQTWASEHYAYGDVGNTGLKTETGGPVSLTRYTGPTLLPDLSFITAANDSGGVTAPGYELSFVMEGADAGPVATAGYGLPFTVAANGAGGPAATTGYDLDSAPLITAEPYRDDAMFYKVEDAYNTYIFDVEMVYHFDARGGTPISDITLNARFGIDYDGNVYGNDSSDLLNWNNYPMRYADFALDHEALDDGLGGKVMIPPLPTGYEPTDTTKALISTALPMRTMNIDWYYFTDSYGPFHMYYQAIEPTTGEEGGEEGDEEGGGDWVKIVDKLAATNFASEGYTITEVEFSEKNLLTHMRLNAPEEGDFVVYYDGTYAYNMDPSEGSPT